MRPPSAGRRSRAGGQGSGAEEERLRLVHIKEMEEQIERERVKMEAEAAARLKLEMEQEREKERERSRALMQAAERKRVAEQQVANATAHEIRLETGVAQRAHHLQGVVADQFRRNAVIARPVTSGPRREGGLRR